MKPHHDGDEEERLVADLVHLRDDCPGLTSTEPHVVERSNEERVELARRPEEGEPGGSDALDDGWLPPLRGQLGTGLGSVGAHGQGSVNETK